MFIEKWIHDLKGWQRICAALMLGVFSGTAFAPLYFFPALLLGFAGLVLLLDEAIRPPHRIRAAAAIGWAFAFGQFLLGLHWIVYPFMVDPTSHLWQLPFALCLLPAGLGLFGSLACAIAAVFWREGVSRLIVLAVSYAATEWLRGHVLTGFPWNLAGYGWGASLAVTQSIALVGSYGLSFLTILFGVSLAALVRRRFALPASMTLLFACIWGFGSHRLAEPSITVPNVALRLVQPNVPQPEMHGRFVTRNWQRLLALSNSPGHPTHIIWPESAAAFSLARQPWALEDIGRLTAHGKVLITGAIRQTGTWQDFRWFNSLYIFGTSGRLLGVYDKTRLVPFGEYVPYPNLLNAIGIAQLTGLMSASPGDGPHRYPVPHAPSMTPLICYEAIFPGEVVPMEGRPGWFINVTDDSWFGPWAGPAQHLLTARMRSIEEGIPMARSANTGISAVIDAKGRIVAQLPLNRTGVVDAALPGVLPPTLYARFGDLLFTLLLLTATALAAVLHWYPPRQNVKRGAV
jgi:apolipoprotein N-acyltransferase